MDKVKTEASYLAPDIALMVREFSEGKEIGETARISVIEDIFAWKRGFVNCWTGWPNDGKTTFFFFMALVKSMIDGWKWCIWSPEMLSSHRLNKKVVTSASDIYDDLIYMKTGKTPYKHFAQRYNIQQLTLDEYMAAIEWVEKYFYVIHPTDRRPGSVFNTFKFMFDKYGCDGYLIDPFKSFKQQEDGRTDLVLDELFLTSKEFSLETHSSVNYIAHPKSQRETKEKDGPNKGRYKVVTQDMLSGGAAWDNGMDGIFSIYRPERHLSPIDPKVTFFNLKQRKSHLVARRGAYEDIRFDFLTNRYYFDGICPIDGQLSKERKKKQGEPVINFTESKTSKLKDDEVPF